VRALAAGRGPLLCPDASEKVALAGPLTGSLCVGAHTPVDPLSYGGAVIIAVDGHSAAGKTTWCRTVAEEFVREYLPTGREPGCDDAVLKARYWRAVNTKRWSQLLDLERRDALSLCDSDPLTLQYL